MIVPLTNGKLSVLPNIRNLNFCHYIHHISEPHTLLPTIASTSFFDTTNASTFFQAANHILSYLEIVPACPGRAKGPSSVSTALPDNISMILRLSFKGLFSPSTNYRYRRSGAVLSSSSQPQNLEE